MAVPLLTATRLEPNDPTAPKQPDADVDAFCATALSVANAEATGQPVTLGMVERRFAELASHQPDCLCGLCDGGADRRNDETPPAGGRGVNRPPVQRGPSSSWGGGPIAATGLDRSAKHPPRIRQGVRHILCRAAHQGRDHD
jgi:hypothetical protein